MTASVDGCGLSLGKYTPQLAKQKSNRKDLGFDSLSDDGTFLPKMVQNAASFGYWFSGYFYPAGKRAF
jgi:hypothetical protein